MNGWAGLFKWSRNKERLVVGRVSLGIIVPNALMYTLTVSVNWLEKQEAGQMEL